jgi:hypothetical protein
VTYLLGKLKQSKIQIKELEAKNKILAAALDLSRVRVSEAESRPCTGSTRPATARPGESERLQSIVVHYKNTLKNERLYHKAISSERGAKFAEKNEIESLFLECISAT